MKIITETDKQRLLNAGAQKVTVWNGNFENSCDSYRFDITEEIKVIVMLGQINIECKNKSTGITKPLEDYSEERLAEIVKALSGKILNFEKEETITAGCVVQHKVETWRKYVVVEKSNSATSGRCILYDFESNEISTLTYIDEYERIASSLDEYCKKVYQNDFKASVTSHEIEEETAKKALEKTKEEQLKIVSKSYITCVNPYERQIIVKALENLGLRFNYKDEREAQKAFIYVLENSLSNFCLKSDDGEFYANYPSKMKKIEYNNVKKLFFEKKNY